MYELCIPNMHVGLVEMARLLVDQGYFSPPDTEQMGDVKNAPVRRLGRPVHVEIQNPTQRVVFHPETNSNPFVFFFGSLNSILLNLKPLSTVGKMLGEERRGIPQILFINDTYSSYFEADDGRLAVHVASRSADFVQDCVHASVVQEFVAKVADMEIGTMWWTSSNVNVMKKTYEDVVVKMAEKAPSDPYADGTVKPYRMLGITPNRWTRELDTFVKTKGKSSFSDLFFSNVAIPLLEAGEALNTKNFDKARMEAAGCFATDWGTACREWVVRAGMRCIDDV